MTQLRTSRQLTPATNRSQTAGKQRAKPPLIILGGEVNALSVARSLWRQGVEVFALNEPASLLRYSRACRWIKTDPRRQPADAWLDFLTGPESDHLSGAVLLAASDAAIELIARQRESLAGKFVLDDSNPQAQLCMLNKLCTYRAARTAGVPTPRFWSARSVAEIEASRDEFVYPLLVKPELSHVFFAKYQRKYLVVNSYEELQQTLRSVEEKDVRFLLVEYMEGPDDRACSYYTYLDGDGKPLFHYTKRIIRRYPMNEGFACYHVTDHIPEVRELSLRLFQHVGLRGLAHAEFKRDQRDGQLKLIECNARFTGANGLVAKSGFDLGQFVYNRLTGQPQEKLTNYRDNMYEWYPVEDFLAFCQLRRRGEITFRQWVKSLLHRQLLPVFRWTDPAPSLAGGCRYIRRYLKKSFATTARASIPKSAPNTGVRPDHLPRETQVT